MPETRSGGATTAAKSLPPDEKLTAAEFGQMVAALTKAGVTGLELAAVITTQKSRRQNANEIKKWLKIRPKAK
ncbi:MAG: hypothetical protein BroJett042_31710 [Bacteroidota bacterium]|nr:MAG: hypothetical protein BroJett042_31710 [Bacteroidota bacterium]